MQISIIIPIYNAEKYLKKAVLSALNQKETAEVILIEDASTDKSFQLCQSLSRQHPKVQVFRHDDGQNHGAGASRNLGIQNAKCDYIAFLDADDFYLENRFKDTFSTFDQHPTALGVYEPVGIHYYAHNKKTLFLNYNKGSEIDRVYPPVEPKHLFETLLLGGKGYFQLNGLVVKKEIFQKVGFFDKTLKQAQDTDLILKMSLTMQLFAGQVHRIIAKRGLHDTNRIFNEAEGLINHRKLYQKWFQLMLSQQWNKKVNRILVRRYLEVHSFIHQFNQFPKLRKCAKIGLALYLIIRHPRLIFKLF